MSQIIINTGNADKGNGDPIRIAFTKVNDNFTELYTLLSSTTVDNIPPEAPSEGALWWDPVSGRLFISYNNNWVDASPVDGAGISSTNELVNGNKTVSLATTGILTLPYSNYLETTDVNLKVGSQGSVTIRSNAASNLTDHEWIFDASGNLSVPNRITFNDNSWQSTAFIGHAYSLKNNPNGSLYVTLDDNGTINTPLLLPKTFTAVLDTAHYVGEGTLVLDGDAWEYTVQFQVEQDGTVQTMFGNQPWPSNPGYIHGLEFEFLEADHGIPDYTFTLTLNSIQNPNPGVYTANPAVSPPPDYPATVKSLGAIKLAADEATWVFGTGGQLTVPGPIFRDGGLYMNSSGSTTAASVFVSGNSGGVILRTADNAQEISYDLIFDVNGNLTLPGRLNFSDGSTLGDNILTGAVDSDLGLEIKRIVTVSSVAAAGSTTGTLIVDISEDDDITVVLDGWEINAGTGLAPIWMAVTETTVDPGNTYEIVVPEFVFEPSNTYTFRNPVPESQTWFIRNQTGGLVAPGGAIITNETADLGEGLTYRELAIELPTPDGLNEQRWVFANDGTLESPTNGTINTTRLDADHLNASYINFQTNNPIQVGQGGGGKFAVAMKRFQVVASAPTSSIGSDGDVVGCVAFDSTYIYYCTGLYNGVSNIWKRITWSGDTW